MERMRKREIEREGERGRDIGGQEVVQQFRLHDFYSCGASQKILKHNKKQLV